MFYPTDTFIHILASSYYIFAVLSLNRSCIIYKMCPLISTYVGVGVSGICVCWCQPCTAAIWSDYWYDAEDVLSVL